jgi:hypothetical protein
VTGQTRPTLVVSFRDAGEPRALANRFVAVARRHARGWTVDLSEGGRYETVTFDTAAEIVTRETRVRHLLIMWTENP